MYLILQDFLGVLCSWVVRITGKLFKYCVTIHMYVCVFVHLCIPAYMYMYLQMGIKSLNIGWSAIVHKSATGKNFFSTAQERLPLCSKRRAAKLINIKT